MTPTERESLYPREVADAWWWLDTYCRHYATVHVDQQTTKFLPRADRPKAARCLWILRRFRLLKTTRGYKGNFIKKPL